MNAATMKGEYHTLTILTVTIVIWFAETKSRIMDALYTAHGFIIYSNRTPNLSSNYV